MAHPAPDGGDREAIQALLNRRADAIRDRDRRAFAATMKDAPGVFRSRQLRLFDHLGDLDLGLYDAEVDWGAVGDLVRDRDRSLYPDADEVAIPLTHERYRLAGYDARRVHQDLYLTFAKVDGEWSIVSDDDLDDIGLYSARNVWDFSPVTTEPGRHFLAIGARCGGCPQVGGVLVGAAERALSLVDEYWTRAWHRRVPLIAPRSSADLARMIQSTYPVQNYLAFAFWTGGPAQNPGVRVIVNPERVAFGDLFDVFAHELTHVAALGSRGSFTPSFVDEGLAQYVGVDGAGEAVAAADATARSSRPRLPQDHEFFLGDGAAVFSSYQRSLSAVAFFVERFGFRRFQRFYVTLGRATRVPGTRRYHLDRAFERVIGMDAREFERAWASSID
ncbi:MAG: hypothetical protein ACRDLB_08025 [Actinomycetota bacterium]